MKVGRDILGELGGDKGGAQTSQQDEKDLSYPWVRRPKEEAEKCEDADRSVYLACCRKRGS